MGVYSFRINGPGVDVWETVAAKDLDETLELIGLYVEKFKRDAQRRETGTAVDYDALLNLYRQMGGA